MIKTVRIKIVPQKLPSFTSTTVFQQLTGCKLDVSVTVSINYVTSPFVRFNSRR